MVALTNLLALAAATLTLANPIFSRDVEVDVDATDDGTLRLTPCATVKCAAGYRCQAIGNRARCVPFRDVEIGQQCGEVICAAGLTCCNASCNKCVPPGVMCTQQVCTKPEPIIEPKPTKPVPSKPVSTKPVPTPSSTGKPGKGQGPKCGSNRCDAGDVCCNDSCGICTPPGGACIALYCGKVM